MGSAAEAGRAWRDIAEHAYRAYATVMRNPLPITDLSVAAECAVASQGVPDWQDLSLSARVAWEAAIRHAANCSSRSMELPHESMWIGWMPPI